MKADKAAIAAARQRFPADKRLILLYGPDVSASRDLADGIARQFADPTDPLGTTLLAGGDLDKDAGALLAAASAVSMFGGRTLVRVEDAGDDAAPAVAALLGAAVAGNPVVMTAGALKKTSKLLAAAEASPAALAFISYMPDARGMVALVGEIAAEFGLRLSNPAARAVADASGGERGILRRELEKLALYLDADPSGTQPVAIEDVAALSADIGDADLGALVDAVAGSAAPAADRQLTRLAAQGIPGITLLRAVTRRFWLLLELRLAVDGGSSAASAVDAARPPVFWKDKPAIAAQLGDWPTPVVRTVLARLLATERAIKRSGTAGDVLAAQFLLGLAARKLQRTGGRS